MGIADPAEDPLSRLLGQSWASIDGEDICRECQTAAERRDVVAPTIISVFQQWNNESTKAGAAPSPFDAAIVPYAMDVSDAVRSGDASTPAPEASAVQIDPHSHPRLARLEVAITGAFLTGYPLHIRIAEYPDVQHALATALSKNRRAGWQSGAAQMREGTYSSGGGFSDVLPLVLVCRDGADVLERARAILDARRRDERYRLDSDLEEWEVSPRSMRIEVYDLGVAVINGTFAVRFPTPLTLADAVRALKRMVSLRSDSEQAGSPIAGMLRKLSKETTHQFRASVDSTVPRRVQQPWLSPSELGHRVSSEWGRLLWLHPVHLLAGEDAAWRKLRAKELAPAFSTTIKVQDGRFVSGIGWSAIVTNLDPSAREMPLKLVHLHWAYYALYMEIDRGLLTVLDQNRSGTKRTALSELEDGANAVFEDYIRVMKARARVDSALASLGGDEQAIWDVIADVQKFGALVGGVDRKVDALQRIADRRVQQATSASDRRTARILGSLTSLALVTLATTLLAYFYGGFSAPHNDPQPPLRWLFLVVGVVIAVIVWLAALWWPRRRTWRKPHQSAE